MSVALAERKIKQIPFIVAQLDANKLATRHSLATPFIERNHIQSLSLQEEVTRIKSEPLQSNTPWYYLAGTGFYVREQIAQIMRGLHGEVTQNKKLSDVIDGEMLKVREDITSFEQEYLRQLLLLPITLERRVIDGKESIVAPKYNGKLWKYAVTHEERSGAVYQTLFDSSSEGKKCVQDWLLVSKPGSMAIMISPSGWSGVEDAQKNKIVYPETQLYVWQIQADGQPKGFAFRYNPSFAQNVEFQKRLGLPEIPVEETPENVMAMVRNVAFLEPDNGIINNFQDVVTLMQDIKGSSIAYQGKSFDEIRKLLTEPGILWNHDERTLSLIEEFQNFARLELSHINSDTERCLQIGLAVTVLQITNNYKRKLHETNSANYIESTNLRRTVRNELPIGAFFFRMNYQEEAQELKKMPGCGGGGLKLEEETDNGLGLTRINSAINRAGKIEGENSTGDYEFDHEGTCVKCGNGPLDLGPCDICFSCDAELGGKATGIAA